MAHSHVLILSDDPESARLWALGISQYSVPAMAVILDEGTARKFAGETFSLILIDINRCLPSARSLCEYMRSAFSGPMLLLTHTHDERFHLGAYEAGIDESISKPIGLHLMIAKTEAWLRAASRFAASDRHVMEFGGLQLDANRRIVQTAEGTNLQLSSNECELLALLIRYRGRTVRSALIIDRIWGEGVIEGMSQLRNLVHRIRRKLEPEPGHPKYLETVVGQGYRIRTARNRTGAEPIP